MAAIERAGHRPTVSTPRQRWASDPQRGRENALRVISGRLAVRCSGSEFLRFLKHVAKAYPRVKLHLVCDNYGTHKHPAVQAWLAKNPRITMHFTPTSGSWLNMVEIFFGIITRQAIRRGAFTSVKDLIAAIETFIDGWNERCQPFIWTNVGGTVLTCVYHSTWRSVCPVHPVPWSIHGTNPSHAAPIRRPSAPSALWSRRFGHPAGLAQAKDRFDKAAFDAAPGRHGGYPARQPAATSALPRTAFGRT